ncbi:hypothetical protein PoB_006763400 [Plakobranchus ocellatus]|uniref:Uncharacterized protein n=1 Tax=Plakobranchus ocellatus TaxID=259542 RepID=A0AAV4DAF7_9GAST|nr:hypothetical protein PoB_006763400 [Plakobranchus ocellatus]
MRGVGGTVDSKYALRLQEFFRRRFEPHHRRPNLTAGRGRHGGTVASESALISSGTLLSRIQARHQRSGLTEGLKAWDNLVDWPYTNITSRSPQTCKHFQSVTGH